MNTSIATSFGQLGQILTICPNCADIFYLSESRPYLKGSRPKCVVDRLRAESRKLDALEEKLDLMETALREQAALEGLRAAKKSLKRIDPLFSGSGYDPQDVKVIFNPVSFIIFQGLAEKNLRNVTLLATAAQDAATERVHKSIELAVQRGNFDFKVLRVDAQGIVSTE